MILDKDMIFAFPRFHGVKHGYSFKTRDDRLMTIFRRQFDQKWQEAVATQQKYLFPDAVARIQEICCR
jgi:hypothetical protein